MQTLYDYVCICPSSWTGIDCSENAVCNQSEYRNKLGTNLTFDKIVLGSIGFSTELCLGNTSNADLPLASRYCLNNGSLNLSTPKQIECDMDLSDVMQKLNLNSIDGKERAASQVVILTRFPQNLTSENVTSTTNILSKIMTNPKSLKIETAKNAIQIFCNMLETKTDFVNQVLAELLCLTEHLESLTIFHSLDQVCPQVAVKSNGIKSTTNHSGSGLVSYQNNAIDLERDAIKSISRANDINNDNFEAYIFISNNSSNADARFGFVLYKDSSLFPTPKKKASIMLKTPVISGTVGNDTFRGEVTIKLRKKDLNYGFYLNNFECAYWNYTEEEWQTNGCEKVDENDNGTHFTCRCSHLTSFAVLMTVNSENLQHLDIISYIGCALSILGLLATIIAPMLMRDYRKSVNGKLQINLSVALLGVYITFLVGAINSIWAKTGAEKSETASFENPFCTASTWLLHFFLLASFAWMCVQGIALYSSFQRIIQQMETSYFATVSMGVAWGGAAVIAIITIAVKLPTGYRQEMICWLAIPNGTNTKFFSGENVLFWAFMFPVALMLLLNLVIFGLIMSKIVCTRKNLKSYRGSFKATLRKNFIVVFANTVTLGLCWVTGYLMLIKGAYTFFSTIFCILNSLQGVFIFLLCLIHLKEFRNRMKQPMNILKREKKSNISMSSLIIKGN